MNKIWIYVISHVRPVGQSDSGGGGGEGGEGSCFVCLLFSCDAFPVA